MPQKIFDLLPTPLNTANDTSPSGFTVVRSGYPQNAGGLTAGDYVDLTASQAAANTNTASNYPALRAGRYRRVLVAAGASSGNVAQGKIAVLAPGQSVINVVIATAGSGQTAGTYTITASSGTAQISVTVGSGGTVTAQPIVLNQGSGYTSVPTFTLSAGGTAATFQAQMSAPLDTVTSYDNGTGSLPVGVFLNSITPGNYGWIQQAGEAYVLGKSSFTGTAAVGVNLNSAATGVVDVPSSTTADINLTIGQAIDLPVAGQLFKAILTLPQFVQ